MFASLLGIALAIAPIVATPPPPAPAPAPPPQAEEVFAIPPALREALHAQVIVPGGNSDQQRLNRLVRFLFDPAGLGMSYQHDADHTVTEAWQTRKANCLSFTLLTIALAREAGIDAYGQEINRILSWYREGDTLYFSNHVNAGMRAGGHRYTVDVASDSILSGEPPRQIDDTRLLAILYTNRAAGLLARGQYVQAGDYMAAAFRADDSYPAAWNNAGVMALRTGRKDDAERDFRRTLDLDSTHEGALMNLAALHASRGERSEELQLRRRIDRIQRRNPFHHFLLATEDETQGDYASAAKGYRRAIALYDGEHQFHYGLARAYLHLGQYRKAGDALRRAQSLASRSTAQRYQAKLDQLARKGL
ncbi:tetratricopeptide repeat protein [Luteimonas sp. A482]